MIQAERYTAIRELSKKLVSRSAEVRLEELIDDPGDVINPTSKQFDLLLKAFAQEVEERHELP